MSGILRALVFFVLTLFWGVIGFHTGGGLAGGIVAVLGSGISAEVADIIADARNPQAKFSWGNVIYSAVGIVVSLLIILSFVYAKG